MNICVRDVKEQLFRTFKAETVRENKKMGEALNEAIKLWLKKKKTTKPKYRFMDLKPFDPGPGCEDLSERVDEIVYGIKK